MSALVAACATFPLACGGEQDESTQSVPPPPATPAPTPTPEAEEPEAEPEKEKPEDSSAGGREEDEKVDGGSSGGGSSGGGGGGPYDREKPDTEDNDVPPPRGSPAERFEQFCEQNPRECD